MTKVRIAKYIASCGVSSRRKSEELILAGRISVNGEVINSPALDIEPGVDTVLLDDHVLEPQKKVYYLLNKSIGYTCSLSDVHAKKLVNELIPDAELAWPVGRLDRDTSGLIILTNDGELTQRLTHPKYKKSKTYIAVIDKPLEEGQLADLASGIELDDGRIKPDEVKSLGINKYKVTIHEGRNRLVRRMFEHFGRKVIALERTRLASLAIGDLKTGEYRVLTDQEVKELANA